MDSKYYLHSIPCNATTGSIYTMSCADPFIIVAGRDSVDAKLVIPASSSTPRYISAGGVEGMPYLSGLCRAVPSTERVFFNFAPNASVDAVIIATLSDEYPNAKVGTLA